MYEIALVVYIVFATPRTRQEGHAVLTTVRDGRFIVTGGFENIRFLLTIRIRFRRFGQLSKVTLFIFVPTGLLTGKFKFPFKSILPYAQKKSGKTAVVVRNCDLWIIIRIKLTNLHLFFFSQKCIHSQYFDTGSIVIRINPYPNYNPDQVN